MTTVVCVDGTVLEPQNATVSVFDRGFLYGDSVYEVLRTYKGVPFELDAHLQRLEGSAERIGMSLPLSLSHLAQETLAALSASGNAESYVRLVVTRGSGRIGLDPALAVAPRRILIVQDLAEMRPNPTIYEEGVEVTLVGVRRNLRSAIDPMAKTGNYLNSVMAIAEARARGGYEAIMLDHRDFITEGSSSNIFVVVGGLIITPSLEVGILRGVTRGVVMSVAEAAGIRVLELPLASEVLDRADEVFITSTVREVVPVVRIDGRKIGDGKPGPVTRRVRELFAAYVDRHVAQARSNAQRSSS